MNNMRSGKGTNHYADGDVYTGDWFDDIQMVKVYINFKMVICMKVTT